MEVSRQEWKGILQRYVIVNVWFNLKVQKQGADRETEKTLPRIQASPLSGLVVCAPAEQQSAGKRRLQIPLDNGTSGLSNSLQKAATIDHDQLGCSSRLQTAGVYHLVEEVEVARGMEEPRRARLTARGMIYFMGKL